MPISKDVTKLIREATNQGWTITLTNGNHYKWVSPAGAFFFSPRTPSDFRGIDNLKRDLRVNGFIEIHRKQRRK